MKKNIYNTFYVLALIFFLASTSFAQTSVYILGDATPVGWNIGSPIPLTEHASDSNVFIWQGHLNSGEFKFPLFTGDWCDGRWINSAVPNQGISSSAFIYTQGCNGPDNKWRINNGEEGEYLIQLDLDEETIHINPLLPTQVENYESHKLEGNLLTIRTINHFYTLQAFSEDIVRVGFSDDSTTLSNTSKVVVAAPSAIGRVNELADAVTYQTNNLEVVIRKNPIQLSFIYLGDTLLKEKQGFQFLGEKKCLSFDMGAEEAFHGTGFRALDMNLRGKSLEMNNQARYGYGAGVENLNIAIPFVVSSRKYGIYFDHIYPGSISLGSSDGALTYKSDHSALSYYFLASPSMPELMDDYTQLTGKAPLPPRWALGYIQSKFGYENEAEARAIVAQMKNENFPLDALVLDLYWFGDPNDMGNLNWDNSRFPDPETMISDFKEDGVKTILITEPYVTTNSANYNTVINNDLVATDASDAAFVINNFWAGAAVLLDLIDTTAQNWMWQFYQEKIDQGVAGWWCDLGEPENHPLHVQHHGKPAAEVHNYFSWEWSKMLQEKYQEAYPNQRLFNLIRSGYAGMQRFGAIPWSGDIQRSFEGMQIQVPIMINMGYSGVGYMHSDLGGFTGGSQNNELYTRWLQLGTFSPIMRAHGVDIPTEPVFYPDTYKNIVRRFIELRYTLLPYNYSLAYENAVTGAPMARAMDFYDPGNTALHNINDQYFWGEQMLIAPVLEEGASTREVQLPEGKWINYFTNQAYNGNTTITVAAPMETMPVFVKSGSLLPHTKLVSSTDHYLADNFSIWYYPDADQPLSSYTLFNDDGLSPNSLVDGDFELIDLTANYLADSTVIQVRHRGDFLAQPESRILEFRIKNINRIPTEVSINNTIVPTFNDSSMYAVISEAAYYDAAENEVYVHTTWDNTDLEIILKSLFTTRTTRLNKPAATLKVYPTVIDQNATIECTLEKSNTYRLDLVNRFGQIIHTFFNQRGTQTNFTLKWQVNQNISPGLYYLRLSGQKGMKATPVVIMK